MGWFCGDLRPGSNRSMYRHHNTIAVQYEQTLTLLQTPNFWPILWLKVDLLAVPPPRLQAWTFRLFHQRSPGLLQHYTIMTPQMSLHVTKVSCLSVIVSLCLMCCHSVCHSLCLCVSSVVPDFFFFQRTENSFPNSLKSPHWWTTLVDCKW